MELSDRELCDALEERAMFDVSDSGRYFQTAYTLSSCFIWSD